MAALRLLGSRVLPATCAWKSEIDQNRVPTFALDHPRCQEQTILLLSKTTGDANFKSGKLQLSLSCTRSAGLSSRQAAAASPEASDSALRRSPRFTAGFRSGSRELRWIVRRSGLGAFSLRATPVHPASSVLGDLRDPWPLRLLWRRDLGPAACGGAPSKGVLALHSDTLRSQHPDPLQSACGFSSRTLVGRGRQVVLK